MASSSLSPSRGALPHYPSDTTTVEEEDSPLLSNTSTSPSQPPTEDPTALYVKLLETHLPWHKRPSALWLIPIFAIIAVSGGMLSSSIGQYQASLLCRQFFTHYTPANATLATIIEKVRQEPDGLTRFLFDAVDMEMNGMVVPLLPVPECRQPDIQGYTAKILAMLDVLSALTGKHSSNWDGGRKCRILELIMINLLGTLSIGYYASLSDKYGRIPFLLLTPLNTLWLMCGLVIMGTYWDQVGLYLMFIGMTVSGLLGGIGVGSTMALAYAADCTDPSKRSTMFSWLHAALFFGLTVG